MGRILIVVALAGTALGVLASRSDGAVADLMFSIGITLTGVTLLVMVVLYIWVRTILAGSQIKGVFETIDRATETLHPRFGIWTGPLVGIGMALMVIVPVLLRHWMH